MTRGMVVCSQPAAAEAGWDVLRAGGNAVDAAVAAALTQAVVDPLNAGIGGFGVAQIRPAGAAAPTMVGFHARAPMLARPDMYEVVGEMSLAPLASGTWPVRDDANQIGPLSVGVPGTVAGLDEIARRFGTMGWPALSSAATRLCEEGWAMSAETLAEWSREGPASRLDPLTRLTYSADAAAVYTDHGALLRPGRMVVNRALGRTLRTLAADGPRTFYEGGVADAIAAGFERDGGLVRRADLEGFRVEVGAPLERGYRGLRVTTAPPPAGGLVVLDILRRLEASDLARCGHNSAAYVRRVAAAMRGAFATMRAHLGDPDFADVPVDAILAGDGTAPGAPPPGGGPEETTHLCVLDEAGTCVSMTHTLGAASGVVTPGLGFIFNGAMHRFDPVPGRPNSIAPGKRRVTGMSPTIVWRGDTPVMLVGAAGGTSIVAAIAQCILNVVEFGMDALAAVSAPRFHCEGDVITLEGRFPRGVAAELAAAGERVEVVPRQFDRVVAAAVQALTTGGARPGAGADPRAAGVAMGDLPL